MKVKEFYNIGKKDNGANLCFVFVTYFLKSPSLSCRLWAMGDEVKCTSTVPWVYF